MADRTHVSELLAEVFRRGGMKRGMKRAQAVLLWPQVAGAQLARFSRARNLVDGVLIVDVPDSETAMHLTLQRQRFLDVMRGKYGAREVRDIRFQTGRTQPATAAAPEPKEDAAEIDPSDMSRLSRALGELDLPEELSQPALAAARSMLAYRARRKAEGWQQCPTCGALTPEAGLCVTCRRYATQPLVRRAAQELVVQPLRPLDHLSEEEGAVARMLARQELEGTISELLPQVVAQPALRPQLEAAARCLLALRLDKAPTEVDDRDMASLPPKVARILGSWS